MGFTPYGFYICGTAGAIDRCFGLNVGRKEIPSPKDMLTEQSKSLCRYCGFFWFTFLTETERIINTNKGNVSKSWVKVLRNYNQKKPILSRY